jgi:1-acyl-sn-glycerol-3-phosphate acyltransferase
MVKMNKRGNRKETTIGGGVNRKKKICGGWLVVKLEGLRRSERHHHPWKENNSPINTADFLCRFYAFSQ